MKITFLSFSKRYEINSICMQKTYEYHKYSKKKEKEKNNWEKSI